MWPVPWRGRPTTPPRRGKGGRAVCGKGFLPRRSADPPIRRVARPTASSTSVFHSPQASQRPAHFGCSAPHSVQRNTERALATARLGRRIPQGAVVEAGEFALEVQRHETGRAVALLADEQLGQTLDVVPVF